MKCEEVVTQTFGIVLQSTLRVVLEGVFQIGSH